MVASSPFLAVALSDGMEEVEEGCSVQYEQPASSEFSGFDSTNGRNVSESMDHEFRLDFE